MSERSAVEHLYVIIVTPPPRHLGQRLLDAIRNRSHAPRFELLKASSAREAAEWYDDGDTAKTMIVVGSGRYSEIESVDVAVFHDYDTGRRLFTAVRVEPAYAFSAYTSGTGKQLRA